MSEDIKLHTGESVSLNNLATYQLTLLNLCRAGATLLDVKLQLQSLVDLCFGGERIPTDNKYFKALNDACLINADGSPMPEVAEIARATFTKKTATEFVDHVSGKTPPGMAVFDGFTEVGRLRASRE